MIPVIAGSLAATVRVAALRSSGGGYGGEDLVGTSAGRTGNLTNAATVFIKPWRQRKR
jgi:hypothetical protein